MSQKNSPETGAERGRAVSDWTPALNGISSGVVIAALLAAGAHAVGLDRDEIAAATAPPRPLLASAPQTPIPPAPLWQPVEVQLLPELPAPPQPEWTTAPAPVQMAVIGSRRGGLGPMGPLAGPLDTSLHPLGPVMGPQWTRNPLPYIGQQVPQPARGASPAGARLPSEASSELPDMRKLELSRLAHPDLQARGNQPAVPAKGPDAAAQQPLSLSLSVAHPAKGFQVGEPVAVRMSANADCNVALLRVDASGKSTTLFRSPGPGRRFACVLRAGPTGGAEYLVAVASLHPLDGADAAAALRASGAGFSAVPAVSEGTAPGQAWSLAVSQASALGGAAAHWERQEWAVATASFGTRPAVITAKRPAAPAPNGPAGLKPVANGPSGAGGNSPEGSQLPGGSTKPAVKPTDGSDAKTSRPDAAPADAANAPKAVTPKTDATPAHSDTGTSDVPAREIGEK